MSLTNIEAKAVIKALESQAKGDVAVGEHSFDREITIKIKGKVTKNADEEYVPTVSIPTIDALVLALHYAGCTRDKALELIEKAMVVAVSTNRPVEIVSSADISAVEKKVKKTLAKLPKAMRTGKTFVSIESVTIK